jgi:hypothetical protein
VRSRPGFIPPKQGCEHLTRTVDPRLKKPLSEAETEIMRPLTFVAAAVAALACSGTAVGQSLPQHGFLVFKDSRPGATTEVRAWGTGRLVFSGKSLKLKVKKHNSAACQDDSFAVAGPFWHGSTDYLVNVDSTPSYMNETKALNNLKDAARAWEHFDTDCKKAKENPKDKVKYRTDYDGKTRREPTLVTELTGDGVNTVGWTSLAGTVCDGATACVVFEYEDDEILESDLAMEEDLTRYGFQDFWTTDDSTWFNDVGGRWAISDVATHEFGHFAGLDHVLESPDLTMFPFVHDGAQTLGLGDMLGIQALY